MNTPGGHYNIVSHFELNTLLYPFPPTFHRGSHDEQG